MTDSSDELGTAAEEQLHQMRLKGLQDLSVSGFNHWHLTLENVPKRLYDCVILSIPELVISK